MRLTDRATVGVTVAGVGMVIAIVLMAAAGSDAGAPREMDRLLAETPDDSDFIHLPYISRALAATPSPTSTPLASPSPTNTPSASPRPSATLPPSSTPTQIPTATPTLVPGEIANGDFENGRDGSWQESNNYDRTLIRRGDSVEPPVSPTSGWWLAALAAREPNEVSQIWQTVALPASSLMFLQFNYLIESEESCDVPYYDNISVYIGATQVVNQWVCYSHSMDDWDTYIIDLSSYAGQTGNITFEASTSWDPGRTTYYLDDISIITVTPSPPGSGIYGQVLDGGAAADGITLLLFACDSPESCSNISITVTDGDGYYGFRGVPTLSSGKSYHVKFFNGDSGYNGDDPNHLSWWRSFDITLYAAGSNMEGGTFDIADVVLQWPPDGSSQTLPTTFTWAGRGVSGDRYSWAIADGYHVSGEYCYVDPPEDATSFVLDGTQAGACGLYHSEPYLWYVYAANGNWSAGYGRSYYYRDLTFSAGS